MHRTFNEYRTGITVNANGGGGTCRVKGFSRSSELLGMYGLLRRAVDTKPFPTETDGEREVFLTLRRVVDILLSAKRRRITLRLGAHLLREANTECNTKHKVINRIPIGYTILLFVFRHTPISVHM